MAVSAELRDWQRISVGGAAREALALVEKDLKDEQYTTDMKAYALINAGRLTAEQALAFFHAKHAIYTLLVRLNQQAKMGTSAAQRLEEGDNG